MATLSTLKLSAAVKPTSVPAVQLRRNKLVLRLWEQCELARASCWHHICPSKVPKCRGTRHWHTPTGGNAQAS
jgi:hypothetical protein